MTRLPNRFPFVAMAKTDRCPVAAMACPQKKIFGFQFHPEVTHRFFFFFFSFISLFLFFFLFLFLFFLLFILVCFFLVLSFDPFIFPSLL